MTPLARHIDSRDLRQAARRAWLLRGTPGPLVRLVNKRLWPGPLRHMRVIAPGYRFEPLADRSWVMLSGSAEIARSVPFGKLVGSLEKRSVTLVASGPSAADFPWDTLRQRFIIAVNGACSFLRDLGIAPDLLVMTDAEFPRTGHRLLARAPEVPMVTTCSAASVLMAVSPDDLFRRKFAIIERVNAWYGVPALDLAALAALNASSGSPFHLPAGDARKFKVGWSADPALGFFSGCTVTFAALQIATGLGARDIEIVGMDLGGHGRSYAEAADAPRSLLEEQYEPYILPSFELMHQALAGSGVSIRNHSPVCPLPWSFFQG